MHDNTTSKIDRVLHNCRPWKYLFARNQCVALHSPIPGVGFSAGQGMAQTSSCGQVPASSARAPAVRRSAKEATKRDLNVMVR